MAPPTRCIIANSGNKIFAQTRGYVEKYTEGYLCTKCEIFILMYKGMTENDIDPLLPLSWPTWPDSDETQNWYVAPPTECINQVSIWYTKVCWNEPRKLGRTDTDGRTFPQNNTTVFKWMYKNYQNCEILSLLHVANIMSMNLVQNDNYIRY